MLTLSGASNTYGAIHYSGGDFDYLDNLFGTMISSLTPKDSDTWFSIEREDPNFRLNIYYENSDPGSDIHLYGLSEYQNDLMFGEINRLALAGDLSNNAKFNFLFDSGFFFGWDSYFKEGFNYTVLAPGFSLDLQKQGLVALSFDYVKSDFQNEIAGYDLDYKQYFDNTKIYGQSYLLKGSSEATSSAGLNYQVFKTLTLGLAGTRYPNLNVYAGGFTINNKLLIVNALRGKIATGYYSNASIMLKTSETLTQLSSETRTYVN